MIDRGPPVFRTGDYAFAAGDRRERLRGTGPKAYDERMVIVRGGSASHDGVMSGVC